METNKLILTILIIGTLFLTGCQDKKEKTVIEKREIIKSVFVVKPKVKNQIQNRLFSATASSYNQIKLSFKVQGNLKYFKLKLGDEIKKGDVIGELDATPYKLKVSQIEYGLSEVAIALKNAKRTLSRVKTCIPEQLYLCFSKSP